MNITNDDKTVRNPVVDSQVSSQECRICYEKCNQVWQIFHPTNEEIPRKIMEFAAVQVRISPFDLLASQLFVYIVLDFYTVPFLPVLAF